MVFSGKQILVFLYPEQSEETKRYAFVCTELGDKDRRVGLAKYSNMAMLFVFLLGQKVKVLLRVELFSPAQSRTKDKGGRFLFVGTVSFCEKLSTPVSFVILAISFSELTVPFTFRQGWGWGTGREEGGEQVLFWERLGEGAAVGKD